jgi:DNA-binding phage protein
MWAESIEFDLRVSERENDEDVTEFLRKLLQKIDENDWTQNVLITLINDAGTRTFAVEAGRSQESLRAVAEEFIG